VLSYGHVVVEDALVLGQVAFVVHFEDEDVIHVPCVHEGDVDDEGLVGEGFEFLLAVVDAVDEPFYAWTRVAGDLAGELKQKAWYCRNSYVAVAYIIGQWLFIK